MTSWALITCTDSNYEEPQASLCTAGDNSVDHMLAPTGQGTSPLTSAGETLTMHSFFYSRNITKHLLYASY